MKNYNPTEIEAKWQKKWEEAGWPKAKDFDNKRPKFYALVEFPYPSGEGLHMGHAFTCTILDIFARKKRMEGFNVLYPMGWDAFGLPTENYAIRTGIHPQVATKRNTGCFREQMKRLAFAYNWDQEINTTDASYYKWTQWIFIQLFKHGLAYKKKMPINWCPSCKIGLANEEVVNGACERCGAKVAKKELSQWLLRITAYADRLADELDLVDFPESVKAAQRNWIGRSDGLEEEWQVEGMDLKLKTFTTWPHTTWGATFMVIAPEHPIIDGLVKGTEYEDGAKAFCEKAIRNKIEDPFNVEKNKEGFFLGRYVINPLSGRRMPLYIANFAIYEYGTGIVKCTPTHDQRDFEFAKKYDLDFVPVIYPKGGQPLDPQEMKEAYTGEGLMMNAGQFDGMPTERARKAIGDYSVAQGHGRWTVNYKLRDWIFSRQHYWGEPIPMVYCESCARKGITWWRTEEGKEFLENNQNGALCHPEKEPFASLEDRLRDDEEPVLSLSKESRTNVGSPPPAGCLHPQDPPAGEAGILLPTSRDQNDSSQLAGWFPVAEEKLPVELPEVEKYQPTGTGESPLAAIKDWVNVACPECGGAARRETDTMPNWAGSSWYYLAYTFWHKLGRPPRETCPRRNLQGFLGPNLEGWGIRQVEELAAKSSVFKKNQDLINYWMPVDLYLGGAEHTTLHLLYSRFWHKFLNDIGAAPGKEPYAKRRVHGVVLGEDGYRMSKSRGNVINPEDIIGKMGVDTLRLYLMFMGPYDETMPWSTKGVVGCHRFLDRVWRIGTSAGETRPIPQPSRLDPRKPRRFSSGRLENAEVKEIESDPELERKLHRLIKKVGEDIEAMKFNTAVAAMMEFLNSWSLRLRSAKENPRQGKPSRFKNPNLEGLGIGAGGKSAGLGKADVGKFLRVLAPFAPHISEELWQCIRENPSQNPRKSVFSSIHNQPWPEYDPELAKEEEIEIAVQVNGKLRGVVSLPSEEAENKEKALRKAREDEKIAAWLAGKVVKKEIFVPGKILNFVTQPLANPDPDSSPFEYPQGDPE